MAEPDLSFLVPVWQRMSRHPPAFSPQALAPAPNLHGNPRHNPDLKEDLGGGAQTSLERPERQVHLPLPAPCVLPTSPVTQPGPLHPSLPKEPTPKIPQVCPTARHTGAWMEACPLHLPQRLLLLGVAALAAPVPHTGEYEGAWFGQAGDSGPTTLRDYVSQITLAQMVSDPMSQGKLENCLVLPGPPSPPHPLWVATAPSHTSGGLGAVGQFSGLASEILRALEFDSPVFTPSPCLFLCFSPNITVSAEVSGFCFCFSFSRSKMGIIAPCSLRDYYYCAFKVR